MKNLFPWIAIGACVVAAIIVLVVTRETYTWETWKYLGPGTSFEKTRDTYDSSWQLERLNAVLAFLGWSLSERRTVALGAVSEGTVPFIHDRAIQSEIAKHTRWTALVQVGPRWASMNDRLRSLMALKAHYAFLAEVDIAFRDSTESIYGYAVFVFASDGSLIAAKIKDPHTMVDSIQTFVPGEIPRQEIPWVLHPITP